MVGVPIGILGGHNDSSEEDLLSRLEGVVSIQYGLEDPHHRAPVGSTSAKSVACWNLDLDDLRGRLVFGHRQGEDVVIVGVQCTGFSLNV